MPASAANALSGPAASLRPQPHANGPSRSMAQGTPNAHHRTHKHSTSADITDSRLQRPSQRTHDKDLPPAPAISHRPPSRPAQMTPHPSADALSSGIRSLRPQEAERYKAQLQQKNQERDSPATPSSYGHGSLSSSHGSQYHGHTYSSSHGHTMTTASQSSQTSGSSTGRHRSATVAGYHGGGNRLDTSTSSSSSAQGHSSSSRLRRKPVKPFEETLAEHLHWEPGTEPAVMSPTDEHMPRTGSGRSRNRSIGVYRDPPNSATIPMNGQETWSRATGATAASSTKMLGQAQYVLQESPNHPPPSTSLGRHHHSAHASIPAGSARTTVQTFFTPNGTPAAAAASSSHNQDKLVYRASSSNDHGSGSASSNTPTPKANQFTTQAHALAQANNAYNPKTSKLVISASDLAVNATTAPAGMAKFSVPMMNSSSDEPQQQQQRSHRVRKNSHHQTPSASASGHAISPSTASASTEGSSHADGEADGSDLWRSGTSLSQTSHSRASTDQKRVYQQQQQQQPQPQPQLHQHQHQQPRLRSRGISDAPAPPTHYRPGTAMSGNGEDEQRVGRGRAKEKDTSFLGRVRARSNSLTKSISRAIQYPIYLAKGGKRGSKQALGVNANENGSSGALAYSDLGHGRTSGEDNAFDYTYTPSTSTSTTTTTTASTAASPVSSKHPGPNGNGNGNGNPSKSSVNILPEQHKYTTPLKHHSKREHKRSLSAQPALGQPHALSPPPPAVSQSRPRGTTTGSGGISGAAASVLPRLRKPLSAKERQERDYNRASPMTRAKNDILQIWVGVDLAPRQSGIIPPQVQITQSRSGEGTATGVGIAFPRVMERGGGEREERERAPPPLPPIGYIPFMVDSPLPRRK